MAAPRNPKPTADETAGDDTPAVDTSPSRANSARPNDLPIGGHAPPNSTLAERAKARAAREKRVAAAQNKAVEAEDAETK